MAVKIVEVVSKEDYEVQKAELAARMAELNKYKGKVKKVVFNGPYEKISRKLTEAITQKFGKKNVAMVSGIKVYTMYSEIEACGRQEGFYISLRKVNNNVLSLTLRIDPESKIHHYISPATLDLRFAEVSDYVDYLLGTMTTA